MYISKNALWLIAACFTVLAIAAYLQSQSNHFAADISSEDIPVVIRTNGGLLEVATVKHRKNFDLTKAFTVLGYTVPFCKEAANYRMTVYTTYRVKLAKRWEADLENDRLLVTAPPLEPALPVAFDTAGLQSTFSRCLFAPSMDTKTELLKSISTKLSVAAKSSAYKDLARDSGARDTVREFVQKWLVTQKGYDIPANTPIDVKFADE